VSVEFDEWLSEQEAAKKVRKSVRTLRDWRRKRTGPPYSYFGRTPRYRASALVEHFRASEIKPLRGEKNTSRSK
jgi:hypothetical protein